MYKAVAFTHKASQEQLEIVCTCLKFLEAQEGKLFNIPTHRVEDHVKSHCIVITFGDQASKEVELIVSSKKNKNCKHFSLPHPDQLIKSEENTEYRKKAFDVLTEVKELLHTDIFIPENIKVEEADIPELNARQILLLSRMTEDIDRDNCFQVNKGGKLIEISKTPVEESKADIQITFEELYTIRSIMDVLQVTEVEIVPNSTQDNE